MKKLLAMTLSILLLLTLFPINVFAAYNNDSNLKTVTGTANRDAFEKLGTGFNALGNVEFTNTVGVDYSILNHDQVEALLLSTSETRGESKYAKSSEELMLSFGIDYKQSKDATIPIKEATIGLGSKFGINANLKDHEIHESIYYYFIRQTITNKYSLYLPETKMDNPEEFISEDFRKAYEKLAVDASDPNIETFYQTWGTHILTDYNRGAALEYVASSHITDKNTTFSAKLTDTLSGSVGIDKMSVKATQEIAADVSAELKEKEVTLNHKWYSYGGNSEYVGVKDADDESLNIDKWDDTIKEGPFVVIPQSTQWKAIWEFIPDEYADLKKSLQNYYQMKAEGVNAAFFERFTTYGVTGGTNTYYTSTAKDPSGNNLIFKMPMRDNFVVAPGSKVNIVNMGTDLSKYTAVISPAGYATMDENGVVTFATNAQSGSKVTIQLKEVKADGSIGSARVTASYTIKKEGADGTFAGGYGDNTRPYLIATASQFSNIRNYNSSPFVLINDITLGSMAPIPNFYGTLDGNGYTLKGWKYSITSAGSLGLFNEISSTEKSVGTVKNLHITEFNMTTSGNPEGILYAGLLCGENKGIIENVHVTHSTIYGDMGDLNKDWGNQMACVGGLCGLNWKTIKKSGVSYCNGKNRIEARADAHSKKSNAQTRLGGIVGSADGSEILMEDLYSHDNVIIGYTRTNDSYSLSWVDGYHHMGGIVGDIDVNTPVTGNVRRIIAYNNDLSGSYVSYVDENYVGTLCGFARKAKFENCYYKTGDKYFGREDVAAGSTVYAIANPIAKGALSNLNEFGSNGWYQPSSGGDLRIAQNASLAINNAYWDNMYFVGESLNYDGIEVKSIVDGRTEPDETLVNGFSISGYDPSKVGTQTITVTYGKVMGNTSGKLVKGTYTVTVKEPVVEKLSIASMPEQTMFYEGETIDYTGLSVMAMKDNGETENVAFTDLTLSVTDINAINKKVTVSYAGCSTEFIIQIHPVVATGMEIATEAQKKSFAVGEKFHCDGLTLSLIYNNGTTQTLTPDDVNIIAPDTSAYGPKNVRVIYGEFVCDYEIVVDGCIHRDVVTVPAVSSTCTTQGCQEYVICTFCNTIVSGSNKPLPVLPHTYNNNCDVDCNSCGAIRMVGPHIYDNACDGNCNECGAGRQVGKHVYDSICDAECNECGYLRQVNPHQYDNPCDPNCNNCGLWRDVIGHIYDNDCDAICNICSGYRMVSPHVYDNFCDAYCNVCFAQRQVGSHDYDNACDVDCNICGNVREVGDHEYDNACDDDCNICGDTREVGEHKYDNACDADCNICGADREVGDHEYDNACDADCNICGADREVGDHEYDNACDADCNICGGTREVGDHEYDNACDADCNICGGTREVGDHEYDNACDADCNICGADREVGDHEYDNACDADCNICGADREVGDHEYDNACDADCNACGANRTVGDHIWEGGSCSICGIASPSKVTITTQPKSANYGKEGATVKVTVKAEGEGLKYQWYIKNSGKTSYSKSSVTTATYSATANDKSHNRRLYCVITDQYGNSVKTNTVLIRRQASITKEPATVAYAKNGAKASIKITAKGDGLKYAWYIKNDGAAKYSKSSVTSATYSATMSSKVKGRRVYCIVTDKYGKKVQSKTFLLRESVSITTQPKTVTVKKNATAKLTVKASGDGLKYTWYIKNAGSSKYSKSSVTKSTYSATMSSKVNGRLVYCVVTDKYGNTVKSTTVKLKMK